MKKKYKYIILVICLIINASLIAFVFVPYYKNYQKEQEKIKQEEIIKNAIKIVEVKEDNNINFYESDIHVSSMIDYINGTIIDDPIINTNEIGEQEVSFEYINDDDIRIPYTIKVNIKDVTPPSIWIGSSYTVYVGSGVNVAKDITCIDDYDDQPNCYIEGVYDTETIGKYPVTFVAEDASGNKSTKQITINVIQRPTGESNNGGSTYTETLYSDIIAKYKNENTKIGIDVSGWQKDIDFQAVKDAGVEFVFIKVGGTKGIDADYYVDSRFIRNIEGFNNVGIPVGVYIYSYAHNEETALNEANWILEQIKPYQVDLPVVFDWENWGDVMEFKQSRWSLTKNAKTFLDKVSSEGYQGMLYGSKNYLEKGWLKLDYPTWLAHYAESTSYQGDYTYWQLCDDGIIDGINGHVDIDIMYTNK